MLVPRAMLAVSALFPLATLSTSQGPIRPCTDASLRGPSWTLSDWASEFSDPNSADSITFQLQNSANGYTTRCFRRGGDDVVGTCFWVDNGPGSPERDDTIESYFTFDNTTNHLTVNQTWTCTDIDAGNPYVWTRPSNKRIILGFADSKNIW